MASSLKKGKGERHVVSVLHMVQLVLEVKQTYNVIKGL